MASAYAFDENLLVAEDRIIKCTKVFPKIVLSVYGEQHLQAPNVKDTTGLLATHEVRGWPEMLESVGCMHSSSKNCPATWHIQFIEH